jgi:hypothetical protein
MKSRHSILTTSIASAILTSMPLSAAITALSNADFEAGTDGTVDYQSVTGWFDFASANGDLQQRDNIADPDIPEDTNGSYWLNLVDNVTFVGTRGVYQSFGTHDPGIDSYQVSFTIGQRSDTAGFGNVLVSLYYGSATGADGTPITSLPTLNLADSVTIQGIDHFATLTTKGTKDLQFSLDAAGIATGATLWIAFAAIDDNTNVSASQQSLIDDISITAIPEPRAVLLGGLGLLALLRRRR